MGGSSHLSYMVAIEDIISAPGACLPVREGSVQSKLSPRCQMGMRKRGVMIRGEEVLMCTVRRQLHSVRRKTGGQFKKRRVHPCRKPGEIVGTRSRLLLRGHPMSGSTYGYASRTSAFRSAKEATGKGTLKEGEMRDGE